MKTATMTTHFPTLPAGSFPACRSLLPRIALLCTLAAAAVGAGCGGGAPSAGQAQEPPTVFVAPVREGAVQRKIELVGRTSAIESVDLLARVTGFLERRAFTEGSNVERGQLLFQIEPAPYAAEVSSAEAMVADAAARLENARQYQKRVQSVRSGAVAGSDLDRARADVLAAEAAVAAARAHLETASINLGYTRIQSPISGQIGRAKVTEGNLVSPSTGVLATIVSLDPIHVTFNASEREVLSARQRALSTGEGQPTFVLHLRLANGTLYEHEGAIDFIDPRVDPATGTLAVRSVFPNPDGLLVPGQFVTALLERQQRQTALLVSQQAVQQGQGGTSVSVVGEDGTVETRRVQLGDRDGTEWVVVDGLAAGDSVIVEGWQKVRPGTKVDASPITDQPPSPASEADDKAPNVDKAPDVEAEPSGETAP